MIEIYQCGTEVVLKTGDYKGFIVGISISDSRISYEISYFENGSYTTHYFQDYEFLVSAEIEKNKIGFK